MKRAADTGNDLTVLPEGHQKFLSGAGNEYEPQGVANLNMTDTFRAPRKLRRSVRA
jgi:hypothetical protein